MDKPDFLCTLLANIGSHFDVKRIIERIPSGLGVPGLPSALLSVFQDQRLLVMLREGCQRIMVKDSMQLFNALLARHRRAVAVNEHVRCLACNEIVVGGLDPSQPELILFYCGHVYHSACLIGSPRRDEEEDIDEPTPDGPVQSSLFPGAVSGNLMKHFTPKSTSSSSRVHALSIRCPLCDQHS